jgi:hypothetical protein
MPPVAGPVPLVVVPGGNTGLGAVLGEPDSFCASAAEVEIPKSTRKNNFGFFLLLWGDFL